MSGAPANGEDILEPLRNASRLVDKTASMQAGPAIATICDEYLICSPDMRASIVVALILALVTSRQCEALADVQVAPETEASRETLMAGDRQAAIKVRGDSGGLSRCA